jgi:hypothetical protein
MLCFLGISFFMIGVIWFLDRPLLTIGNILFLTGLMVFFFPQQEPSVRALTCGTASLLLLLLP